MDICAVLTDSDYQTARNYWKWLKNKLIAEIALFAEYRTRLISDVVTGKLDVRGVVVLEFEVVGDGDSEQSEDEVMERGGE